MGARAVFVSGTSADLGSYRAEVVRVLLQRGCHPVEQDHFALTSQTILEKLEAKVAACDAVVCLVGIAYGAEPSPPPSGQPRRSFTQWEYHFARAHRKPVYILLAAANTEFDERPKESQGARDLQRRHRAELERLNQDTATFSDRAELAQHVALLEFPPPRSRGRRAVAAAGVLAVAVVVGLVAWAPWRAPAGAVAAARPPVRDRYDPGLAPEAVASESAAYDRLAELVAGHLAATGADGLRCDGFADFTGERSHQGPGIEFQLTPRLLARGVRVRDADRGPVLAGAYTVAAIDSPTLKGKKFLGPIIQASVYPAGADAPSFRVAVGVPEPLAAARFRGTVVGDVGAGSSLYARQAQVEKAATPVLDLGGARAGGASPFALALVRRGSATPFPLRLTDGRAWATMAKGDEFAIRLTNRAAYDAAVEVTVDGENVVDGSDPKLRCVRVPAGGERDVEGWYTHGDGGAGTNKAFVVTEFERSVAGERKQTEGVGVVSAYFHAAWEGAPPADERGTEARSVPTYGIGRGEATAVVAQVREMQVGRRRASLHVRYAVDE
ncbi:DUF4062 domain-containing protein [Urbifossiella limnaea]|uniref:DUF4062 domain-containing protein n=1 Tax=Urbifossiella limnaea TaxID=2528023 RepID=A0A517XN70_9BACT|nr:DUF4062 domain-containing protein [Urbifossiella limnaea]QDU18942.1 hypothetical protein ETAA1_08400 [Urbifossiella limnaea]